MFITLGRPQNVGYNVRPIVMLAAQFVFRHVNKCKYLICHVTGSWCNQI
jgi:hypothetical protein